MKILNLIKIILLSTILFPIFIASAGFLDDLKSTGEVQKAKKACEKGDAKACYKAGEIFSKNPNVAKKESDAMWTKGCELGDLDSCKQMGKRGDLKAANKGCESEDLDSCVILAEKGDLKAAMKAGQLSNDKDSRMKWFGKVCLGGDTKGCEALCIRGLFNDDLDGCLKLAEIEENKSPDKEEATDEQIKWYLKACDNGNMVGCGLASLYVKDPLEQKKLLVKSCSSITAGCYYLAIWHYNNDRDLKQAVHYMNMACQEKFDDSCEFLERFRKEIADISNKEAADKIAPLLNKLKDACDNGDMDQCFRYGFNLPGTPEEKNLWFKKACDGGHIEGCFYLAKAFEDLGQFNDAIYLYIKACNGGSSPGCDSAGRISLGKLNKPADAKKYYLLACNLKNPNACNSLGGMESKKGNKAEAARYYAKACDGGNTTGCNNLASLQIDWNNIAEARKFLNEACDSGSNAACQKLVALTKAGM